MKRWQGQGQHGAGAPEGNAHFLVASRHALDHLGPEHLCADENRARGQHGGGGRWKRERSTGEERSRAEREGWVGWRAAFNEEPRHVSCFLLRLFPFLRVLFAHRPAMRDNLRTIIQAGRARCLGAGWADAT